MRVVFIGATSFGLRCLEAVASLAEVDVVGVITNPQSFRISYSEEKINNVLYADIAAWAEAQGIPGYIMHNSMKEPGIEKWLVERKPDFLVVVGWYHMVPKSLRNIAPALGLHASLLPDYSGGAPLVWAMINGENQTGITLFQLGNGIDDGPIYGQESTPIYPEDTISTLYQRIEEMGERLLLERLPRIAAGEIVPAMQDEKMRRTFPQRSPTDGIIDWRKPAQEIYNFVRAQTKPYPGAFSFVGDKKVVILRCQICSRQLIEDGGSAGSIIFANNDERVFVQAGDGNCVELVKIEFEGEEMGATSFLSSLDKSGSLEFDAK